MRTMVSIIGFLELVVFREFSVCGCIHCCWVLTFRVKRNHTKLRWLSLRGAASSSSRFGFFPLLSRVLSMTHNSEREFSGKKKSEYKTDRRWPAVKDKTTRKVTWREVGAIEAELWIFLWMLRKLTATQLCHRWHGFNACWDEEWHMKLCWRHLDEINNSLQWITGFNFFIIIFQVDNMLLILTAYKWARHFGKVLSQTSSDLF